MKKDTSFLDTAPRGLWFAKKEYDGKRPASYEEALPHLPVPVLAAHPLWESCYQYAVKVLYRNTHTPAQGSGYVSNFVDAAFNKDIFLWDTCFMTMFCNLFHPYIPGICSLDNFYCKQFDDGEIPREMVRDTGKDFLPWVNAYHAPLYSFFHNHYGFRGLASVGDLPYEALYKPNLGRTVEPPPYLTLDNLNHPILGMAEWESYLQTGDVDRLALVFEPLWHYYQAFRKHLRHASGLYVTDWASMDNSTRNQYLGMGVDISCEMVMLAHNLQDIMAELEKAGRPVADAETRRAALEREAAETTEAIQRWMWDEETGFFYDVRDDMTRAPVKTAAAFWALISGVATPAQQQRLYGWLNDPATFCRVHRVPVLAADEPGYDPRGGYWRGSVWAPINTMVVLGLERCGNHALAREIARNDLSVLAQVFEQTGTIWENYPPDLISSADSDHPDMVGWSGIAPILFLMEYAVGLRVEGPDHRLCWELEPEYLAAGPVGCDRYWFCGQTADFRAQRCDGGIQITIRTEGQFPLLLRCGKAEKQIQVNGDTELVWEI